jgi:fumarate reductase flavoprotein subunit
MATKVMDCDLVVLGAAGSGLVAAVKAADVSGKKVIVLEKAKKPGGASIFASGMGDVGDIKDSKWQKEAGFAVNDPPDIRGQFFDWLVSKGGAESFFRVAKQGEGRMGGAGSIYQPARLEKYKNHPDPSIGPGRMGTYVVDKMIECCEKQGILVLKETRARKFITDDKGKVTAVLADTSDGQLLVNCKACVIAAGGFGRNYEMLQKRWPEEFNNKQIFSLCPPTITGDCINMAEEIGAAIDQTKWTDFPAGFMARIPIHHPYSYTIMQIMLNSMPISINLNGERWMNEGTGMFSTASVASQPKAVSYTIADSDIIEKVGPTIAERGMDEGEKAVMKNWREDIAYEVAIDEEGASGDHAKKADTLAELALKMKIDPKAFIATIERYNKFCENGKDLDFGKDAKSLIPIRKPPFYAFFGHRFSQCTKGMNGIIVNNNFEVINKKGEVIPGLYATGDGCTIYGGNSIMSSRRRMSGAPGAGRSGAPAGGASAPGDATGGGAPGGAAAPSAGSSPGAATGAAGGGAPGSAPPGGAGATGAGSDPGAAAGAAGGGAPGSAPSGARGGAPGASTAGTNILSTEPAACAGLGAAFVSGYIAAINASNYLKNI